MPLPRKLMNFSSQNGVAWCILGVLFFKIHVSNGLQFRCHNIGGGGQHRTTPAGQILGGRDPCDPCGVDAYGCAAVPEVRRLVLEHGRRAFVDDRQALVDRHLESDHLDGVRSRRRRSHQPLQSRHLSHRHTTDLLC